jgi:hemerythrin
MSQVVFKASLAPEIPRIDEPHCLFLDMLTELGAQIEAGHHWQGTMDALQGMRVYAGGHFADEEALMAEKGYPERLDHKQLHDTFREMVGRLEGRLGDGPEAASRETLEYLTAWFTGHIRNEDQRFTAFSRSRFKPT